MKAAVLAFTLLATTQSALGAPDEAELGRDDGYPVCPRGPGFMSDPKCLVGLYSHYGNVFPSRQVEGGKFARDLLVSAQEPPGVDAFMAANRNTGLLVLRGDTILAERYQYNRLPRHRFTSMSMAKTVVAILAGIALEEGRIRSLDQPAAEFVPQLRGHPFGETPLRHLLTMSSGVRFVELYNGSDDISKLGRATLGREGPSGAAALLPFKTRVAPPGTKFAYSSADTFVLSLVLRAATGKPLTRYLSEKIWQPMGAEEDASWNVDAEGNELGWCCLNATLRDWGRLGLLLADGGARDGRQIIPAAWVKQLATVHGPHLAVGTATPRNGYGYQTWIIDNRGRFALLGVRGQAVMVDPHTRTVMVHTAVHADPRDAAARGPQFRFFYDTLRTLGNH